MKKRTALKVLMIAGLAAVAVFAFTGCEALNLKMEVEGTWVKEGDFPQKWEIKDGVFNVYYSLDGTEPAYSYNIVEFDNGGFNGGETGQGECGYAVISIKTPSQYMPESGYNILRWQNLEVVDGETKVDMIEGYKDGEYLDSAEDAKTTVTKENGWFAFGYTEDFVLQAE